MRSCSLGHCEPYINLVVVRALYIAEFSLRSGEVAGQEQNSQDNKVGVMRFLGYDSCSFLKSDGLYISVSIQYSLLRDQR